HRVLGAPIESFDPQVLLDPLKEQFNLPALTVELSYQQGTQTEVVGQEDQTAECLGVIEAHSAQFIGILFDSVESVKRNDLVAPHASAWVHWPRSQSAITHPALGPDNEPGAGPFNGMEPLVIDVAPVHEIEGPGFVVQVVQPGDFLRFCRRNMHSGWQRPTQIQLSV